MLRRRASSHLALRGDLVLVAGLVVGVLNLRLALPTADHHQLAGLKLVDVNCRTGESMSETVPSYVKLDMLDRDPLILLQALPPLILRLHPFLKRPDFIGCKCRRLEQITAEVRVVPQRPVFRGAVSGGERKDLGEFLRWFHEPQGGSRSVVQAVLNGQDFSGAV